MKLPLLMLGLIIGGVVLVGLSLVWPSAARSASPWTPEEAKEHAQAGGKAHHLGHELIHKGNKATSVDRAAFQEAKERFDRADAALLEAQNRGQKTAAILKWLGIVCVLLGGGGFLILRRDEK